MFVFLLLVAIVGATSPRRHHPVTQKCGVNEKYYKLQPCPPNNCDISYTTYNCDGVTRKPGCDCAENYLRYNGTCILNEKCPPPRPPCTGCICKEGYKRIVNKDGTSTCIPEEDYPKSKCGVNEKFYENKPCPPNNCDISYTTYNCDGVSREPGCDCAENYLRYNGTCILNEKCPPPPTPDPAPADQCPANEVFVPCAVQCSNAYCPTDDFRGIRLCDPPYPCPSGCVCKVGYRRSESGNGTSPCIPAEECPPVECTRDYEVWDTCPRCLDESCSAVNNPPTTCNELIKNCQPRCVCEKGHYRNNREKCVPEDQCPNKKCGVNEKFYERKPCPPNNCDISYTTYNCDGVSREPGCDCAENYLRYNGTCISNEECPPPNPGELECGPDEYYEPCSYPCPPQNCSSIWSRYACDQNQTCSPACRCKNGFRDDKTGVCKTVFECMGKTCGPNETYYGEKPCPPLNCNISYTEYDCSKSLREEGCDCKENYLRNSDGKCVLNEECPAPKPVELECGPDEYYEPCSCPCPPQTCASIHIRFACDRHQTCAPACRCKDGLLRDNKTGACKTVQQCMRPKCGPNEKYFPVKPCPPRECAKSYTTYICDGLPEPRGPGCDCIDGYLRGPDGRCRPKEKCPPPKSKCGVNEKFYEKKPCPPNNCDISYTTYNCDCVSREPGCDCAENYLRYNGTCILNEKCPPPPTPDPDPADQCPANEVFVPCAVQCSNAYCPTDDFRGIRLCDPPYPCPSGCVCKVGYRRSESGNVTSPCIPAEECPLVECTRDYEVWDTCPRCLDESCSAVNNPPTICNELIKNCQPRCICEKGHYRNNRDKCVPEDQCPNKKCGVNEKFYERQPCPPNNCDISYTTYNCDGVSREPGCDCAENYLRYNGTCISNEECPPPNPVELECGPDEYYEPCSYPCPPQNCSSIWSRYACDQNQTCSPACRCKNGFRDDKTGVCKTVFECMGKKCGPNETYYGEKPCPPLNCNISYTEYDCSKSLREEGCDCKENYLRNSDGKCVLNEECPAPKPVELECGPDEYYEPCSCPCPPQTCASIHIRFACDRHQTCAPACRCKDGLLRDNKTGACKTVQQCMRPKCGPNEKYFPVKPCPPRECAKSYTTYICDGLTEPRGPGCDCIDGYLRGPDGRCRPKEKCPPPNQQCGANETYAYCSPKCPEEYCPADDNPGAVCDAPMNCPSGCACKPNYLRNKLFEDDTCILAKDCPPVKCTKQNEVWSPCSSPCLMESCDSVCDKNASQACESRVSCVPRCVCSKGHCRNADNICVPAKQCPLKKKECPKQV